MLPVLILAVFTAAPLGVIFGLGVALFILTREERCLVNELSTLTVLSSILNGDLGACGDAAAANFMDFIEGVFGFDSPRFGVCGFFFNLLGEAVTLD
jgi:hypothetical protein